MQFLKRKVCMIKMFKPRKFAPLSTHILAIHTSPSTADICYPQGHSLGPCGLPGPQQFRHSLGTWVEEREELCFAKMSHTLRTHTNGNCATKKVILFSLYSQPTAFMLVSRYKSVASAASAWKNLNRNPILQIPIPI